MTDFVAYSTCFRMKNCWSCRKQSSRQNVAKQDLEKKCPCKKKEKKNENQNEIGESFLFNANLWMAKEMHARNMIQIDRRSGSFLHIKTNKHTQTNTRMNIYLYKKWHMNVHLFTVFAGLINWNENNDQNELARTDVWFYCVQALGAICKYNANTQWNTMVSAKIAIITNE